MGKKAEWQFLNRAGHGVPGISFQLQLHFIKRSPLTFLQASAGSQVRSRRSRYTVLSSGSIFPTDRTSGDGRGNRNADRVSLLNQPRFRPPYPRITPDLPTLDRKDGADGNGTGCGHDERSEPVQPTFPCLRDTVSRLHRIHLPQEYTKLGKTGLDVSKICLGCMSCACFLHAYLVKSMRKC